MALVNMAADRIVKAIQKDPNHRMTRRLESMDYPQPIIIQ